MSKRFGRNQKRKMRQQIETLGEALELSDGLNRHLSNLHDDDMRVIRSVERELGQHNVLLNPRITSRDPAPGSSTICIQSMETPAYYDIHKANEAVSDDVVKHSLLHKLQSGEDLQWLKQQMHIKFYLNDASVGYALSYEAIQSAPEEVLVQHLSQTMAQHLVQTLREVKHV